MRWRRLFLPVLGLGAALAAGVAAPAAAAPHKLGGSLLAPRTPARAPAERDGVPLVITLSRTPTAEDLGELAALGVTLDADADGFVVVRGRALAATAARPALAALAALPWVARVELDGHAFAPPRPLDFTAHLVGVDAVHRREDAEGRPLAGSGVTICDVDSGIDVLHPMFFRADAGLYAFIDENENGFLDPGVDSVEVDGQKAKLRVMNGIVSSYWSPEPKFGTDAPELDLTYDYLYADLDGDGARGAGVEAGFSEDTPAYGEPLFVADDVDGDGEIGADEKLARLGSSKLAAFRLENKTYRRGENLIEAPWKDDFQHGNGAGGVLVGGQPGYGRLVGMAPDADLVMATDRRGNREFAMTNFCVNEGARVVLHEYAPWITYHLDGSSALETLIDDTVATGVVHVNPAGNLSTADKMMRRTLDPSGTTQIPIEIPAIGATYLIATMLWRDTSRDLTFRLEAPDGSGIDLPTGGQGFQGSFLGKTIFAVREDSSRGTAKVDLYLIDEAAPVPIPTGTFRLIVGDSSGLAPIELVGTVFDEVSGWGGGIRFTEDVTEDHLVGWPGTADHGLGVSAFTGHDWDETGATGQRAFYSGRGHRIDGAPLLWISAPDNPIVPAHFAERELAWMIYGGTSGASPHVAGSAALVLEADPTLDGEGVKARIKAGAVTDAATGAVPNDDFGWGKLDAHRAIFGEPAADGQPPTIAGGALELALGAHEIPLEVADPDDPASALTVEVDLDYDGTWDTTLAGPSPTLALALDAPGSSVLKLRVVDPSGRTGQALLRVTAFAPEEEPPPDETPAAPGFFATGGGGCRVVPAGSTRDAAPALALGALALALGARRRRGRAPVRRAAASRAPEEKSRL